MSQQSPNKKPPPPNTFYFEATCPQCQEVYTGNFPRWIRVPSFVCMCGATVPVPDNQPGYFEDWFYRFG